MFIAVNVMLAMKGAFDVVAGLIMALNSAALIGSYFFAHSRRTYLIAALALSLVIVRGFYYGVLQPAQQLLTRDPGAQQGWLEVAFQAFGLIMLFLLFRAYTFGAASRQYYGYTLPSKSVAEHGNPDELL